jgi:hypothetical protein
MKHVAIEHIADSLPRGRDQLGPDQQQLVGEHAGRARGPQQLLDLGRGRGEASQRGGRECVFDLRVRLVLRGCPDFVELAFEIADRDTTIRREKVGVVVARPHEREQQAKVVLSLEPPSCELMTTQPCRRSALREGAGHRHRPCELYDLADRRDDEAVAKRVGEGEYEGNHAGSLRWLTTCTKLTERTRERGQRLVEDR